MKLKYVLVLSLPFALSVAVGCDDDRSLGDLGPGQEFGGSGSQAGAPATGGGSDAAGQGGASAGGQGGAGDECPTDFREADGTPCSNEGQICSDGSNDPCGFGNSLLCFGGEWQHQEAFPAPCGGAGSGGAGGTETGGAGGADAGGAGGAPAGGVGGAG